MRVFLKESLTFCYIIYNISDFLFFVLLYISFWNLTIYTNLYIFQAYTQTCALIP